MPVAVGDIKVKLSIKTGAAGHASAQPDPNAALGKFISTTELTDNVLNNLFDDVTGDENATPESEFRCIFVHNSHATLALQNAVAWISAETANGADIAIAVDDIGPVPIAQAGAQADEVANEDTAPGAGVGAFSSPTTKATGLSLGSIPAGQCRAIWVRRTTANRAALDNDSVQISVAGDTSQ